MTVADNIAEQLLGEDQRSSWCGDGDVTGRFVCRRIRDHALDWHAGRNDAGGIHQWKARGVDGGHGNMPAAIRATAAHQNPADCPVGTVLVDPDTGRWAVRFDRGDDTGKGQHVWLAPAGVLADDARFLHHVEVRGWHVGEARRWRLSDDAPAVDKVATELAHLESQRDAWWNQRAAERGTLSGMLRGMARRASAMRRAHGRLAESSKVRTSAYLRVVDAVEGVEPYERSEVTAGRIRAMRAEVEQLRARPAIPADAKPRPAMVRAIADQLGRIAASQDMPYRQEIQDAADALAGRHGAPGSPWDSWSAPVSGSDTRADGSEYCAVEIWPSWANGWVRCCSGFGADGRCQYGHRRPVSSGTAEDTAPDGGHR